MRHYELVTILSPMLNQDEASATWDEIKSFIVNRDGDITAEQIWGTRRLAYPIRKGNYNFLEGSYYLSTFTVDNSFNLELDNYLRLDERVLRSLILNCDGPLPDKPAPGPLTAPSRYIPPGRGRRQDGGAPSPDAPGSFAERRPGGPPASPDAQAAPAPRPEASAVAAATPGPTDSAPAPAAENIAEGVATPGPAGTPEPTTTFEPTPEPTDAAEPTTTFEPTPEPTDAAEPTTTFEPTPEPTDAAEPTATFEPTPEPTDAAETAPAPKPPAETDGDAQA